MFKNTCFCTSSSFFVLFSGDAGDGFPQGCPCGEDPMIDIRKFGQKEIVVYCVGCEPAIQGNSKLMMMSWASLTGGKYVPLANSSLLKDLIVKGAEEELSLESLAWQIDQECVEIAKEIKAKKGLREEFLS